MYFHSVKLLKFDTESDRGLTIIPWCTVYELVWSNFSTYEDMVTHICASKLVFSSIMRCRQFGVRSLAERVVTHRQFGPHEKLQWKFNQNTPPPPPPPASTVYMRQLNRVSIGSGNGLWPVRRQAITWTNAGIWWALGINFSVIRIEMHNFSLWKCIWKCRLPNWRPFCPEGGELKWWTHTFCKRNSFCAKLGMRLWSLRLLNCYVILEACYKTGNFIC